MQDVLECHSVGGEVPLVRKNGHIYREWEKELNMFYNYKELRKPHKKFLHPSSDNLLNPLNLARPWKTDSSTMKILENINRGLDVFQRFSEGPARFSVSHPRKNKLVLRDELLIDTMFLDDDTVLHIVDKGT